MEITISSIPTQIIENKVRFNIDKTQFHYDYYSSEWSSITDSILNDDKLKEETIHPYLLEKQSIKIKSLSSNHKNIKIKLKSIWKFIIKLFFKKNTEKNDEIITKQLQVISNDEIIYDEKSESCGSSISSFNSLIVEHHKYI
jgi:hypothetical protein